jgi:hypothetical protein
MLKTIGALAILMAATPVSAELPTIFGQPLGKPIAYPMCGPDEQSQKETCYTRGDDTVFVAQIPPGQVPAILATNIFTAYLVNGKVEVIIADTKGEWRNVLSSLVEKFGNQTGVNDSTTVVSDTEVPTVLISWQRPDLTVIYSTIGDTLKTGKLQILTNEGRAMIARQNDESDKDKVKL